VDLVGSTLPESCKIFNAGQNGREIPDNGWESAEGVAMQLAAATEPGCAGCAGGQKDLIIIMLGSNDVLLDGLSAEKTAMKMKRFLGAVKMEAPGREILLVAPVSFRTGYWVPDQRYIEESKKLLELYAQLAGEMDVHFADANEWGVSLTDDGVHFTEDGHKAFAEGLTKVLKLWYSIG
jgi:lysophospholipase L1-like esterase